MGPELTFPSSSMGDSPRELAVSLGTLPGVVNTYLVAAFISKCSLKTPYVVSVPKEKGRGKMNGFCLVDMGGNKVIIS